MALPVPDALLLAVVAARLGDSDPKEMLDVWVEMPEFPFSATEDCKLPGVVLKVLWKLVVSETELC